MGNFIKWVDTRYEFDKSRVAKDPENSPVTQAGVTDIPEIKWGNIVLIGDTGEIWSHGTFMGGNAGNLDENPTIIEIKNTLGDIENLLKEL